MVVNNVKQATSTTAYANAVKGLSLEQAKLALSTKQLSAIEKEQILIKAGLLNATGKLTTGQLTEILTNKQRNAEDAKALLLSTGLISAETAEATATNVVETAKLEELVATKQLTVAEAELIAMKAKVTTANIKEASTTTAVSGKMAGSISILGSSVGSALTKIGSGLLSFASAHPIIAALTAVVGLVGITNSQLKKYEQEQKELIENAKTLQDEYRSFVQSSSDNINSLKAQADEFEELSKGVTKYGENISLSADEYDRYKSIVAEVLGYTPELVDGYNAEGTAIANKNSLIERSIELMKEEQRQKLKEMTTDEKTGVAYEGAKAEWNDVNAGYEGAYTRNEIARWFEDNSTSNGWNYEVDIAKILGIKDEWSNEGNNLQNAIINNIDTVAENIKNKKAELLALEDEKGVALFTETEIDNMIEKANDWEKAYTEWQQEIEDSKHGMDDQFALYAQRADGYGDLTDAQRAFVNEYIKATGDIVDADGRILSEDEMIEKAESYEKFVDKLATSPEFADARKKINELFALDSSTIPAGEYEKQVNTILEELQTKFDLSDDEVKDFKIALGFDFIEDGSSTRVSELIEKVQGKLKDDFDDKALDLSLDDLIIASNLEVPKGVELSWEEFIKLLNEAKDIPDEITVSFFDTLNSTENAKVKKELLDLAKSGEITPETLESTEDYVELLSQTSTSAESATNQILDMLSAQEKLSGISQGLDKLKSAYEEFKDEDIGFVTAETLESLPDVFKNLEGFDLFSKIVGDPTQGVEKIQKAFDDIVTEYIRKQGTLTGLVNASESEVNSYIANLKQMGITNAEEVVKSVKNSLSENNTLLQAAESEYIDYLKNKDKYDEDYLSNVASKNGQLISALGSGYQSDYDNWCNLLSKKSEAYNKFVSALGASASSAASKMYTYNDTSAYQNAKKILEDSKVNGVINNNFTNANGFANLNAYLSNSAKYTQQQVNEAKAFVEAYESAQAMSETLNFDLQTLNLDFGGSLGFDNSSKDSSSKSNSSEPSEQTFDWIERKVNNITKALNNLKDASDDTYSSWANRSTALTKAIDTTRQAIELQQQAYSRYMQQAESVGLPDIYKNLIKNGALDISIITDDDLKDKISDYQEWYDKAQDCLDVQKDLMDSLNELNSKKFDNIQSIFEFDKSNIEHSITMLNSYIDKLEMKGLFANESYYNQMLQYTQKEINSLTNERKQLANVMNSSALSQDSEAWREMYSTLTQIDEEILELNNDIVEFNNSIRDLNWEVFEYLEESINRITDETEYLTDLLSNEDLYDDNGNLTKYANATIGLYATAYDTYKQQAKDYYEEVQDLQRQLVNGAGKDVLEQYNEMVDAHQEAVKSANQEKQAILDLISDGYQKQIDYLNEIINKKKDSLNAEKD